MRHVHVIFYQTHSSINTIFSIMKIMMRAAANVKVKVGSEKNEPPTSDSAMVQIACTKLQLACIYCNITSSLLTSFY